MTAEPDATIRGPWLRVVTWNVWFDELAQAERGDALLAELRRLGPDLIALQEVTGPFVARLLSAPWPGDRYCLSSPRTAGWQGHGSLLLSRLPVRGFVEQPLPGGRQGDRRLLCAEVDTPLGPLDFAAVHLEGGSQQGAAREAQLGAALRWLQGRRGDALLVGDFNFDPSDPSAPEERQLAAAGSPELPELVDAWRAVHPEDPGPTVDTDANPMLAEARGGRPRRARFDRILVRSQAWRPVGAVRLGMQPLAPDQPRRLPSDHFGLCATLAPRAA